MQNNNHLTAISAIFRSFFFACFTVFFFACNPAPKVADEQLSIVFEPTGYAVLHLNLMSSFILCLIFENNSQNY
jgi:hypothetical protein